MTPELLDQVVDACDDLGDDEARVIVTLARRLRQGQAAYGRLSLANDRRDFVAERSFEIQDLLIYSAFETLKREAHK